MTAYLRDDPRSRIFVGQGFQIRDVAEPLIPALEAFLKRCPEAIALLEFTSPGYNQRQVDCALVSPGGIDLIEVKNKRGLVTGSADGEWKVTRGRRTDPVVNSKAGEKENPYRQAHKTADDLKGGLKRLFGCWVRITPLVLLPSADPWSIITDHSNVKLALGMDQLTQALRSANRAYGGGWEGANYLELPQRLGLQPMSLSFVRGRVTDAELRRGVPDVDIWAEVAGQRHTTPTDEGGYYSFAVALGSEIGLGFSPPERFLSPDVNSIQADQQYLTVDDVRLASRYPPRTEQEIRGEVLREMEARVQQQVSQAQEAWVNVQASMGLVIDDLAGQLKAAQLRLAEQEQQLQDRLRRQGVPDRLPLPVQVRQANALRVVQEQRSQVEGALQTLQVADNTEQRDAVRQVLDVLTRLELSARRELTPASTAALPVQVLGTTPRQPPTAPAASEPDYVDVEVRQEKAPAPEPQAQPQSGPPPARKSVGWPLLAVALLAAGVGGVAAWIAAPRAAATGPASPGPATPAPVAAPASTSPQAASVEAEAAPAAAPITPAADVVSEPVPSPDQMPPEPEPAGMPEASQPVIAPSPSAPPPAPVSTPATRSPAATPSTIPASASRPAPQPPVTSALPTSSPTAPATPPAALPDPVPTSDRSDLPGEVMFEDSGTPPTTSAPGGADEEALPGVPVE